MNQSSLKCFATHTTHRLFKLKRSAILAMYSGYNSFCWYSILTSNTALPWSSLAVTRDAFCYSGHTHVRIYQQQGSCSILLAMYSTYVNYITYIPSHSIPSIFKARVSSLMLGALKACIN